MATRPSPRLTYEDYVHFPEGQRWELIDGEALVVPSPNLRHQRVADRLLVRITQHLDRSGGGTVISAPFDVVLNPSDVLQPDIVFVSDDHAHVLTEDNIRGAPTWAIEVLSDATRDRKLKLQRYERAGIPEYWIVDPIEDLVEIYILQEDSYGDPAVLRPPARARPSALPGLEVDLGRLLAR